MSGNTIVSCTNRNKLCFYYNDGGIYYNELEGEGVKQGVCLTENVRRDFSVNPAENGEIYIICQGIEGDVYIISRIGDKWEKKTIIRRSSTGTNNILFYSMLNRGGMELIYLVDYGNKDGRIMRQYIEKNGKSRGAEPVDGCLSLPEGCFKIQRISSSRYIILYCKRTGENQLGYMEISGEGRSGFIPVYKTGYRITDSSFTVDKNGIHFLYIVKSMFSSRVIYSRRGENGFSTPVVLYEGQGIGVCALFFARDSLYAAWTANRQIYYTVSHNRGESFEPAARDKRHNGISIIKAAYLKLGEMKTEDFAANEIFTDYMLNPVFMSDFCLKNEKKTIDAGQYKKERDHRENTAENKKQEYDINVEKLKNRLELAQKQIEEKDRQIVRLNDTIQRRNADYIRAEKMLTAKIVHLRQEIEALKAGAVGERAETTEAAKNSEISSIVEKDIKKEAENRQELIKTERNEAKGVQPEGHA